VAGLPASPAGTLEAVAAGGAGVDMVEVVEGVLGEDGFLSRVEMLFLRFFYTKLFVSVWFDRTSSKLVADVFFSFLW
jgi:hypothetical protein